MGELEVTVIAVPLAVIVPSITFGAAGSIFGKARVIENGSGLKEVMEVFEMDWA